MIENTMKIVADLKRKVKVKMFIELIDTNLEVYKEYIGKNLMITKVTTSSLSIDSWYEVMPFPTKPEFVSLDNHHFGIESRWGFKLFKLSDG